MEPPKTPRKQVTCSAGNDCGGQRFTVRVSTANVPSAPNFRRITAQERRLARRNQKLTTARAAVEAARPSEVVASAGRSRCQGAALPLPDHLNERTEDMPQPRLNALTDRLEQQIASQNRAAGMPEKDAKKAARQITDTIADIIILITSSLSVEIRMEG